MMDDDAILARRAAALAARPVELEARAAGRAIVVEIGAQRYAFPLEAVVRVTVLGPITPLPHTSALVLGLGTSEGEILPVFDGRAWSGQAPGARQPRTQAIVLGTAAAPRALAVDALVGSIALVELTRGPPSAERSWLMGMAADGVLVVDVDVMLSAPALSIGRAHSAGDLDDHR